MGHFLPNHPSVDSNHVSSFMINFLLGIPAICSQDFALVQYLETLSMLEVLASSFPVPYQDDFDMSLGPTVVFSECRARNDMICGISCS